VLFHIIEQTSLEKTAMLDLAAVKCVSAVKRKFDLKWRHAAPHWNTKLSLGEERLKEIGSENDQSRSGNPSVTVTTVTAKQ
jgi:hypothetical protein